MKYPVAIILAVGVFFVVGYFISTGPRVPPSSPATDIPAFPQGLVSVSDLAVALGLPAKQAGTTTPSSSLPPTGTKEYRNTSYGFTFLHPSTLTVSSFDEGSGARTITLQNTVDVQGFQIFIVPYEGAQISMARFRADEPSGVMERPVNILVGGTQATMFFSTDAALGDTIEVWLIKNGYLFEITAPKSLDVWLAHIMQTWQFIK